MSNGWTSINVIILEYREKIGGRGGGGNGE